MKRLIVLFLCIQSLNVYAQGSISQYIPIDNYSGLPVITLSSFTDMQNLIQKNSVKSVYIKWDPKNNAQSFLLFKVDNLYYAFNLKGYNTIESYQAGESGKFPDGGTYYTAKTLGISNYDAYLFYNRNGFISVSDCLLAYENGFAQKEKTIDVAVLPLEIQSDLLEKLSKTIPDLNIAVKSRFDVPGKGSINLYNLTGTTYNISDPSKRRYDRRVIGSSSNYVINNINRESLVYYWSMANGIEKYEEYEKLAAAVSSGFYSVEDSETAKQKGFTHGSEYYKAKDAGFVNYTDYELARNFGIQTYNQFEPVKRMIDNVNAIVKQGNKSFIDAAYILFLRELPRKKYYSLSSLAQYANEIFLNKNEIRHYFSTQSVSFGEDSIKHFLTKNPVLDSGTWDATGGVFIRN